MVNENNVYLVKSIGGISFPCGGEIDRMPPTSKCLEHAYVGFYCCWFYYCCLKFYWGWNIMLVAIWAQAIAWKQHSWTSK